MRPWRRHRWTRVILTICFLGAAIFSRADHIIGSDITYKSTDTAGIYTIVFNFYRDCNGCYVLGQSPRCGTTENCASSQTAPTILTVYCKSSGSSLGTINLSRTAIKDITTTCGTSRSRCEQPCNGTFPYGIEKHTFEGRADLRSILSSCCEVEVGVLLYVRNVGITTGQSQQTFYTSCDINTCYDSLNTSPALTNDPVAILCCNQPYTFNNGAVDTADYDSISYAWAPAYRGKNQLCTYSGSRTYLDPISTYYPGSLTWPYTNPNASPPIGTYLNPVTGDIVFTPTNCSEIAVVVIQMTEWRKDSTGVYRKIGVTRRDMQFIVMTCPSNNPPVVNGPYSYSVCEGSQICFNITTDDQVFVPPPPAPTPDPDTVRVSWNRGIPGATFSVIDTTARLQTGRFCWTPQIGQASDLPYTFTVTARDNACPLNAVTVRSFRVKVKPRALAERDIDTLPCGVYSVESNPIAGFRGAPVYRWNILDSNLNLVIDKRIARFRSTNTFLSFNRKDTLIFRRGGKYIIQHTINNSPQDCPTTYYDTLEVPDLLEANVSVGRDTFICAGTTVRLRPYIYNGTAPFSYLWSSMGVNDDGTTKNNAVIELGDTLDYKDMFLPLGQYDTAVALWVQDASGCYSVDTVRVFQKENPTAYLPPDHRICTYDSIYIEPLGFDTAYWVNPAGDTVRQGDTLFKEWYLNGFSVPFSTDSAVTINVRGEYVLRVLDSLGCWDEDTLYLYVNDTVVADAGPDQELCFNDTITLRAGGLDTVGNGKSGTYRWYDLTTNAPLRVNKGTSDSISFIATQSVDYELELYVTEDTTTCLNTDTVSILVNPLPVIDLKPDFEVCCGDGDVAMRLNGLRSTDPIGGIWSVDGQPTWVTGETFHADSACAPTSTAVTLTYTYTIPATGCVNSNDIIVRVNPLPEIVLNEADFCQDKLEFHLADELVGRPANEFNGTQSWKCLECNGNDFAKMLVDKGVGLPDYWLDISEGTYTIQNDQIDTITLEYTFRNPYGCLNRDTVQIRIWKVPKLDFLSGGPLCYDVGITNLNQHFGVNWGEGWWTVENQAGYRAPGALGGINNDSMINTLSSVELNRATDRPNAFYLRYHHDATGCYTFLDTNLVINPLPNIVITPPLASYCDNNIDVPLAATPGGSGGTWSTNVPSALTLPNTFTPSKVIDSEKNKPIWFYYAYTDPSTTCYSIDSVSTKVEPRPIVSLPVDTSFCRIKGQNNMPFSLNISTQYVTGMDWTLIRAQPGFQNVGSGTTEAVNVTLNPSNDTINLYVLQVRTKPSGVCPITGDDMNIYVHPIPDMNIAPLVPDGCNPVTTGFDVTMNNTVDPAAGDYLWTLGNGESSTSSNPTTTYRTDGTNNVSLTFTSDFGCDTTVFTSVDVYPIPVASFDVDPKDRFTTAALPRFILKDRSTVKNILGSNVDAWKWSSPGSDTTRPSSTDQHVTVYYPADTAAYYITLTVTTNHGCTDDTTVRVEIGPDILVYVPNAFTPDNTGPTSNNTFQAFISGEKAMELIIFNRWGEIVFRADSKDQRWDGTFKGEACQQDVYGYKLLVTALDDQVYEFAGTVTLLR